MSRFKEISGRIVRIVGNSLRDGVSVASKEAENLSHKFPPVFEKPILPHNDQSTRIAISSNNESHRNDLSIQSQDSEVLAKLQKYREEKDREEKENFSQNSGDELSESQFFDPDLLREIRSRKSELNKDHHPLYPGVSLKADLSKLAMQHDTESKSKILKEVRKNIKRGLEKSKTPDSNNAASSEIINREFSLIESNALLEHAKWADKIIEDHSGLKPSEKSSIVFRIDQRPPYNEEGTGVLQTGFVPRISNIKDDNSFSNCDGEEIRQPIVVLPLHVAMLGNGLMAFFSGEDDEIKRFLLGKYDYPVNEDVMTWTNGGISTTYNMDTLRDRAQAGFPKLIPPKGYVYMVAIEGIELASILHKESGVDVEDDEVFTGYIPPSRILACRKSLGFGEAYRVEGFTPFYDMLLAEPVINDDSPFLSETFEHDGVFRIFCREEKLHWEEIPKIAEEEWNRNHSVSDKIIDFSTGQKLFQKNIHRDLTCLTMDTIQKKPETFEEMPKEGRKNIARRCGIERSRYKKIESVKDFEREITEKYERSEEAKRNSGPSR